MPAGLDLAYADHWPHGAIRWSEAYDKLGFESIAPLSADGRAELDRYLRENPRVGEGPLFSASMTDSNGLHQALADYWLRKAVKLATIKVVVQDDGGGFNALNSSRAAPRRRHGRRSGRTA